MLDVADLAMLGILLVARPTPDHINVLIPYTVGPTVDAEGPVDLQHVVGLSLGPATDLSSSLPPADLATSLCENSVVLSRTGPAGLLGRGDSYSEKMAQRK